jgi:exodeoxyribonuclease VIII
VHCIIGEGYEEFEKRYVLKPGKMDRRTKAGKDAFDYWLMGINGRQPVDLQAYEAAEGMHAAVREVGWLGRLLDMGTPEVTLRGELHGLKVQCRPDLLVQNINDQEVCDQLGIPLGGSVIIDIKTTSHYDNFKYSIKSFKYHRQAAFYLYLAKEANLSINKFIFLAIDKNMPYDYSIIQLGDETLKLGTLEVLEGLNKLRDFYRDPLAVLKRDVSLETIDIEPPSLF